MIGGFDQLSYVEHLLKTDPFSRRIIISAWSPDKLAEQVLPSCHNYIQFYVTEENGIKYLSCMFMMRSNDGFLGQPLNLVSYSLLVYILAKKCGMQPKEIVHNVVDCHIYKSHIDAVNIQLKRRPRPLPIVNLLDSIKDKDWSQITIDDFDLIGYFPYSSIKAPMAI